MDGSETAQGGTTDAPSPVPAATPAPPARGSTGPTYWWDAPPGPTEPRGWSRFGAAFRTRNQAEALRRSEERLRALLQHSSDVVVVVGRDRRTTYATGAVQRTLGSRPGDLTGPSPAGRVFPH